MLNNRIKKPRKQFIQNDFASFSTLKPPPHFKGIVNFLAVLTCITRCTYNYIYNTVIYDICDTMKSSIIFKEKNSVISQV